MEKKNEGWLPCLIVIGCMIAVYGWTVARDFGSADTFEFQVTAPMLGIAHPTGYPLYLILGKLWTLIPFGTVAWRLNLGTAAYGIGVLVLLYFTLVRLWQRPWSAALVTVIFGVTPTLWSQAIQAEVYTLNLLIVTAVLFLLVERRHWLMMIALCGLGLTNHLTTIFLLPILGVARLYQWRSWQLRPNLFRYLLAFLLPLSLLFYLPIRWQAVNGEAMGWWRFREWVTGDRFAGALQ